MEYKIKARVSNRHLHITKEIYDLLFDEEMIKKYDLSQIGEYACEQVLTIKNGDKEINNVRVCGPFRNYTQIEISKRDARFLGLTPPVRRSGDLTGSLKITLKTNKGMVETDGLVIANRHVHMGLEDAIKYNVKDKQIVQVKIPGDKSGIVDAEVKINDNGFYEFHVDTDDANAFLIEDEDIVTMIV